MKREEESSTWIRARRGTILLVLLVLLVSLPALLIPWSLIDDGESIRRSQEINRFLASADYGRISLPLIKQDHGRFRPLYWLYLWVEYNLFGLTARYHHLGRILLFVVVVLLISGVARQIAGSTRAGILSGLLFALFPFTVENWHRLGPGEPQLVLWQLASLYFLGRAYLEVKRDPGRRALFYLVLSIAILPLSYFSKETSVMLVPVSAVMLLVMGLSFKGRRYRPLRTVFLVYFIANLACGLASQGAAHLLTAGGGYTIHYQIEISRILSTARRYGILLFQGYHLFLVVALVAFSIRLIHHLRKGGGLDQSLKWQIIMLFWFMAALGVQLPWAFALGRHLLPCLAGLTVFMGVEMAHLLGFLSFFSGKKPAVAEGTNHSTDGYSFIKGLLARGIKAVLVLAFLIFAVTGFEAIWSSATYFIERDRANAEAVKFLAENVAPGHHLYLNLGSDSEWFYEIGLHLRLFYHRDDVIVRCLDLESPQSYSEGDFLATWSELRRYPVHLLSRSLGKQITVTKTIHRKQSVLHVKLFPRLKKLLQGRSQPSLFWSGHFSWWIFKFVPPDRLDSQLSHQADYHDEDRAKSWLGT